MRQIIGFLKTPVTLVLLLLLVGYSAKWGYDHVTMPIPSRAAAPCVPTDVGSKLTPEAVTVRVLNGGTKGGLAKRTSTYLRAYDFRVIRVNNTERRIQETIIVGSSPDDPEVKLLLGFFKGAKAEGDGRTDHVVDVLVGDKFATPKKPVTSIPVDGPVCLPAIPASPTPSAAGTPKPTASATKR